MSLPGSNVSLDRTTQEFVHQFLSQLLKLWASVAEPVLANGKSYRGIQLGPEVAITDQAGTLIHLKSGMVVEVSDLSDYISVERLAGVLRLAREKSEQVMRSQREHLFREQNTNS